MAFRDGPELDEAQFEIALEVATYVGVKMLTTLAETFEGFPPDESYSAADLAKTMRESADEWPEKIAAGGVIARSETAAEKGAES